MPFPIPNFRCRISESDRPNKRSSRLISAPDSDAGRRFLEARGYIVHSVVPYDFARWQKAAETESKKAAAARGGSAPKPWIFKALWAPLKDLLLEKFNGRCGYCDAPFAAVSFGDVEHYRPKAGIAEEPGHPGYFWLAYDPENYLPACQKCNQGDAKKNHFPISGNRAWRPTDKLADEKADLLNPEHDDFHAYLKFWPARDDLQLAGRVEPRNRGEHRALKSIEIYNLNRPWLVDWRANHQRAVLTELRMAYMQYAGVDDKNQLMRLRDECLSRRRAFAAALIDEIEHYARCKGFQSPFAMNYP